MQETKFKEAIRYYEPVVKKQQEGDNILSVPAIVLANLCVAYIMTSQNEEAEELMRRVEKEEERGEPDKQVQHTSCTPPAHLLHTSSTPPAHLLHTSCTPPAHLLSCTTPSPGPLDRVPEAGPER